MKLYQVFVNLTGEIVVKAENASQAKDIVNDGFVVVKAVEGGLFDIEIDDICEYEEEV